MTCLKTIPDSSAFTVLEIKSWSELLIIFLNLNAVVGA